MLGNRYYRSATLCSFSHAKKNYSHEPFFCFSRHSDETADMRRCIEFNDEKETYRSLKPM